MSNKTDRFWDALTWSAYTLVGLALAAALWLWFSTV